MNKAYPAVKIVTGGSIRSSTRRSTLCPGLATLATASLARMATDLW